MIRPTPTGVALDVQVIPRAKKTGWDGEAVRILSGERGRKKRVAIDGVSLIRCEN